MLLENVKITDFNSLFHKSLKMKQALRPQYLMNYKKDSENTKMSKQLMLDRQNAKFNKEMETLNQQKEQMMHHRIKRLKYLYRKKTKGTNINLHNINPMSSENPSNGQFKRIKQYEHYI
jgi:hypothetical protein